MGILLDMRGGPGHAAASPELCLCDSAPSANQGEGEAAHPAGGQLGGERPHPHLGAEALGQHGGPQVPGLLASHGQVPGEPREEPGSQL